jgi:hypothetical protein
MTPPIDQRHRTRQTLAGRDCLRIRHLRSANRGARAMQRPSCQHDHLARLSCSQAGPRCRRGPPASRHQHRAAARCSSGMESAVRSTWVESATIAHAQKHRRCQRRRALAATKPNLSRAEPCPPGTEFLDAETGPPKSAPETTDVPRDQKGPEPITEIPAQTAYLSLMGKYAVRQDWVVADAVERNRLFAGNLALENAKARDFPVIENFFPVILSRES